MPAGADRPDDGAVSPVALDLAERLWNYHTLDERPPTTADVVVALGSHDDRVAEHAADLVLAGVAPLLVTTGGFGKITRRIRTEPEGRRFARIAVARGVAPAAVLVEPTAANTGENITLTRALLATRGVPAPETGVLVTKPYMTRRARATARRQWPEVRWWSVAPVIAFADYPTEDVPARRMIELMVGDLYRIRTYADRGFQVRQDIPPDVWQAYEELVALGYDRFVDG